MQVDPIKYTFKAPGTTHLNLKYDNPLSNFAFNSNARRYTEALDLISHMLVYSPALRYTGLEACCHVYFDELRDPAARLPNGRPLPPLFDFSAAELRGASPEMVAKLGRAVQVDSFETRVQSAYGFSA